MSDGGFIFAEDPELPAPEARIIWHVDYDPAVIAATAIPTANRSADVVEPEQLARWLVSVDSDKGEHIVVSDGYNRIRIDLVRGSLKTGTPVTLDYRLSGIVSAQPKLRALGAFLHLVRTGRFARRHFPPDPRLARHVLMLRVHDARAAGASLRVIAEALYPQIDVACSDSIRSRVRRLVREARGMAQGGWRALMHKRPR